jgi:hypothetical protein
VIPELKTAPAFTIPHLAMRIIFRISLRCCCYSCRALSASIFVGSIARLCQDLYRRVTFGAPNVVVLRAVTGEKRAA